MAPPPVPPTPFPAPDEQSARLHRHQPRCLSPTHLPLLSSLSSPCLSPSDPAWRTNGALASSADTYPVYPRVRRSAVPPGSASEIGEQRRDAAGVVPAYADLHRCRLRGRACGTAAWAADLRAVVGAPGTIAERLPRAQPAGGFWGPPTGTDSRAVCSHPKGLGRVGWFSHFVERYSGAGGQDPRPWSAWPTCVSSG